MGGLILARGAATRRERLLLRRRVWTRLVVGGEALVGGRQMPLLSSMLYYCTLVKT